MARKSSKSLIAKLAEACNAVGGVEKKGRNDFQKYAYVKAADIAKAIRRELFSRGILVLIEEKEWKVDRVIKTNSGADVPVMLLHAEITFRDEKDSLGPFSAYATAFDSGDKAIYKAKTGLLKYALRGIGLIPDEKDDTEFDEAVDEQTNDPEGQDFADIRKSQPKKRGKIADYQVRSWDAACHASGKTAEQIAKYLRVRWSTASVTELTPEDFKEAIKWAVGTEDLAKTLETSVQAVKKPQPIVEVLDQIPPDEFDQSATGD